MLSKRMTHGLGLLSLLLLLTACAGNPPCAPQLPVACQEPLIDPTTQGGLAEAVQAYQEALRTCNATNGVGQDGTDTQ
jgi:hypothetical protein